MANTLPVLNPNNPIQYRPGENAVGLEWDCTNINISGGSATLALEDYATRTPISPFNGQSVTIVTGPAPSVLRYSWPNPMTTQLPKGTYRAYCNLTFSDGTHGSTDALLIQVFPA